MFCKNCGTKNDPNKKFCKSCGTPLQIAVNTHPETTVNDDQKKRDEVEKDQSEKQTAINNASSSVKQVTAEDTKVDSKPIKVNESSAIHQTKNQAQKKVKEPKKMKTSTKVLLSIIVLLGISVFGLYKFGEHYYAYENQRERAIEVLKTVDAQQYSELLTSHHPSFDVTEESIVPLVDYLSNNREGYNELMGSLMKDQFSFSPYDVLYFDQAGKYFGLFDRYDLVVTPIQFYVHSNIEDATFTYQNEEVTVTEDNASPYVGLVAPGEQQISAHADFAGEETVIEHTEDILYLDEGGYIPEVYIEFETYTLTVAADVDSGQVYLNDQFLGEFTDGRTEFGPLVWKEGQEITFETTLKSGETYEETVEVLSDLSRYEFDVYPSVTRYSLSEALGNVYDQAAALAEEETEEMLDGLLDGLARLLVNGEENELYSTYKNTGERYLENDQVNEVQYSVVVEDYELVDLTTINVRYEVLVTERGDAFNQFELTFDAVMKIADDGDYLLESAKVRQ